VLRSNFSANIVHKQADFSLWHKRLGHASESKLRHISIVPKARKCMKVRLTCPMAKFSKLPYDLSSSHANESFQLVHIDI